MLLILNLASLFLLTSSSLFFLIFFLFFFGVLKLIPITVLPKRKLAAVDGKNSFL